MRTSRALSHPRDEIMAMMSRIYRYRMTTTSGGNISILDEDGSVWITPAAIDKGGLTVDDIVRVRPDGTCDGKHAPSSELPFHQAVYSVRPDIRSVVHAHPVALVAFSMVGQAPNVNLLHQSHHVCGEVGFAPYALPGSDRLGDSIAGVFAEGYHCVVMESHGVVVGGATLQEAFQRFETLEFAAKTIIKAKQVGEVHYLTEEQIDLPHANFRSLPECSPGPPASREKSVRKQLRDFVRRGYQQRLVISTEGSFSARLDDSSFLITPYQVDRSSVEVDDLVLIKAGEREAGRTPSRAARNHWAIYQRHSEINAIINAYTVNASAFGAAHARIDTRTIPESYVFVRQPGYLEYGVQFTSAEDLAAAITDEQPVCLLENDGMIVTGGSMLQAFDRLEVLESTAEAIINSKPLGVFRAMSDETIAELEQHYF